LLEVKEGKGEVLRRKEKKRWLVWGVHSKYFSHHILVFFLDIYNDTDALFGSFIHAILNCL